MTKKLLLSLGALCLLAAACGDDDDSTTEIVDISGTTVTLMTHDSFVVSDSVFEAFTAETGATVELLQVGDAGTMVSEAILTKDSPLADVMFGIDNTFLQRGLDADLFDAYESTNLGGVFDDLKLDDENRVTPIDFGDVCVNYWIDALPDGAEAPTSLEDLTDPVFADQVVVQSPESSSPGLAFLLATINGTDDWEQYWADLVANGVSVTAGWEDAYYGEFTAGGGDRSVVVSYASSPPAEVIFADPPVDAAPTGVLLDSCFRQIEFAGVLAGAENPAAAQALIDFMLTPTFQEDVPLNMFVFPALEAAELPSEFVEHTEVPDDPQIIAPADIEANRDAWVERWVEIVLG
ncbi:MAG: thiamine ABC transporter substrate-binding protein [Actinomycetota bacterium]